MTTELKAKDFLLHFLKKEYVKRSKVINNLVLHIERLHKDYILTNIERTRHLKLINELIKNLNIIHKLRLDTIKGAQCDEKHDDSNFELDDEKVAEKAGEKTIKLDKVTSLEKNLLDILKIQKKSADTNDDSKQKMLDTCYELSCTIYESELKKYCPNDYESFDKKIYELICSKEKDEYNKVNGIGCKTIGDIVMLFSRPATNLLDLDENEKMLYDILNTTFVPLTIECKKKEAKIQLKVFKENNIPDKYEHLLGNFYRIEINVPNCVDYKQLHVYGFFENDCVGSLTRASQLSNTYLYNKKKHFIELCSGTIKLPKALAKLTNVSSEFKDLFIQNMSLGELIGLDDASFVNEISNDNFIYQRHLAAGNFKNVFSDFQINSSLIKKFKIIKYLLLGHNSNNAGLLFSLTKEQKNGSPVVADIIYKNLSLPLQLKLHKENILIKTEMDKLSSLDTDDIDMKKQIMMNKNIPPKVKKSALEKLNEMKTGGSEYYKQLMYVKTIIDYPWIGENDNDIFTQYKNDQEKWKEIMLSTKAKLDDKVYGHTECKETIVELLAKWFTNPNSLGKSIGLHGPPGIGKTMIAMELGKSLGLPFSKINLAGLDDNSILIGHSSTYASANFGLIVKKMTETQAARCIMFFDELDKTAAHHGRNEITDVLIHVTDATTNAQFNDKFFQDVQFPLNKVLFVFSFNNKEKIDPILLDRMEVIKVDPYSIEDKLNIVNKYLIKEIKADMGMTEFNVKISDSNIVYIIETFTSEAGVRTIKRKIEKIFLKLNAEKIYGTGPFEKNKNSKSIEVTRELIDRYLGKPPILDQKIHLAPEVGYVNGLYATDSGSGGLVDVIMYKNQLGKGGKFAFKITGNLQKVMIDSISLAFTMASNFVKPKYLEQFFENYPNGLHIHSGDLSISKNGPSACTTYTVAFISKILNIKIKNTIAMTGECGGNGNVGAIGGLHYKLIGAKKAGVKFVFAPKENEKDLDKIKASDKTLLDDNFRVMLVSNVKEVLEYALIENEDNDPNNVNDITYAKTFSCDKYLQNSCINNNVKPIHFNTDSDTEDVESDNEEDSDNSEDSDTHSDRSK